MKKSEKGNYQWALMTAMLEKSSHSISPEGYCHPYMTLRSRLHPEDGGSRLFQNISTYLTISRHISEDHNLNTDHSENLKAHQVSVQIPL
jgi:hypothetical protein